MTLKEKLICTMGSIFMWPMLMDSPAGQEEYRKIGALRMWWRAVLSIWRDEESK